MYPTLLMLITGSFFNRCGIDTDDGRGEKLYRGRVKSISLHNGTILFPRQKFPRGTQPWCVFSGRYMPRDKASRLSCDGAGDRAITIE